jgi:hypothetical protein
MKLAQNCVWGQSLALPVLKLLGLLVVIELVSKVPEMFVFNIVKKEIASYFSENSDHMYCNSGSKFFNGGKIIFTEHVYFTVY